MSMDGVAQPITISNSWPWNVYGFLTIDAEEPIYEAIKILGRNGSSQLVVSESGSLWGIITAADLVKSLTPI